MCPRRSEASELERLGGEPSSAFATALRRFFRPAAQWAWAKPALARGARGWGQRAVAVTLGRALCPGSGRRQFVPSSHVDLGGGRLPGPGRSSDVGSLAPAWAGLGSAAELVTHGTARDAAFSPSRPGSAARPDVSPCLESVMGWGPPEGTPRWRCACAWFIREGTAESAAGSEEASRVEQGRQRGVLMRGRLPARLGLRGVGGIAWRPWHGGVGTRPPAPTRPAFPAHCP